jgi:hypothetical protein
VKGGGYSMNLRFLLTSGVEIVLSHFNSTKLNANGRMVKIRASLTWGQVYETLDPAGVSVIGGHIPSIGVAGLILGRGMCLL